MTWERLPLVVQLAIVGAISVVGVPIVVIVACTWPTLSAVIEGARMRR